VLDVSLQRPSGARQSPGGEADGDCGTLDVSLRWECSTWIVDVVLDPTPASRLLEQPVPQSPLRGRLTGTRGGLKTGTNHSRPMGVIDFDLRCPSRPHDGMLVSNLQRPSGARQSPGGEADGDCGTLDVSLRWEWSTWIVDVVLDPTTASRLLEQPVPQSPLRGRLTGTRGGSQARTSHSRPDESGRRRSSMSSSTPRWDRSTSKFDDILDITME
jgi:hypothetical protein